MQNVMAEMEKSPKFIRLALIKVVEEDAGGSLHGVFAALHSVPCKALITAWRFDGRRFTGINVSDKMPGFSFRAIVDSMA